MSSSNSIKVIKRGARARPAQAVAGGAAPETPARVDTHGMAVAVKEWISECRQARRARYQEMEQRFGLLHERGNDQDIE